MVAFVKDEINKRLKAANGYSFEGDVTGNLTGDVTGDINGVSISTGKTAPAAAPTHIGAIFIDTVEGNVYIAAGDKVADWKLITRAE